MAKISLFKGRKIRKVFHNKEWWFVIADVVSVLADSSDPQQYIQKLKQRDPELCQGWVQIVLTLDLTTEGGRQKVNCATTEGIFRIIQSIPSPKAEPFKRWLARVGYERVQEIEDPELATKRTRLLYKLKGYPDDWIEKRMRGIAIREELTDEWQKRGADKSKDYEILTAEISKATFGVTPSQHKKIKGIKQQNLRDHMDDFELIFTMLGERSTTEIHRTEDSHGTLKLKKDAKAGGNIAGNARKALEKKIGRSVVSKKNYLGLSQKKLGFSFIELIVVIAILAIVVVIAMGDYGFAAKQARVQVASEELIAALEEARVNSQTSAGTAGGAAVQESGPRCWGVVVETDGEASTNGEQATFFGWGFSVETQSCVFDEVVLERAVSVDAQIQIDDIRKVEEVGSSSLGSVTVVFAPPSGDLVVYASLSEEPLGGVQQVEIDLSYDGSANEALQRTVKVVPATATFDML